MINGRTVKEWLASDRLGFLDLLKGKNLSDAEIAIAAKWRHPDTDDTIFHIIFRENFTLREKDSKIRALLVLKADAITACLAKKDYTMINHYNKNGQKFY